MRAHANIGGPGGEFTPPTFTPSASPPCIQVGSVHYDDGESDQASATSSRADLGAQSELGETGDIYGTAFAPPLSPPENLTDSGVQRHVDHQLEKYGVTVPGRPAGDDIEQGGGIQMGERPTVGVSEAALTQMDSLQKDQSRETHVTRVGEARVVDTSLAKAKLMMDEEEAELFQEGESLLHGGGTKAVTHRDWYFATLFLGNMAVVLLFFVVFRLFLGGAGTPAQHNLLGRDVSAALYLSGTIALGFAFLWLFILKAAAQVLIKAAIVISLAVTLVVAIFSFSKGGILSGVGFLILAGIEIFYAARFAWPHAEMAAATISVTVSFTSQYPAVFAVVEHHIVQHVSLLSRPYNWTDSGCVLVTHALLGCPGIEEPGPCCDCWVFCVMVFPLSA